MRVKFVVVTKVPKDDRNLADEVLYRIDGKWHVVDEPPADNVPWTWGKKQVFRKGELIVVDADTEREIGYPMRKPSKWLIEGEEYEVFDNIEDAIKKLKEVV